MNIDVKQLGICGANCYMVAGEDYAFIIDPATVDEQLWAFAGQNKNKKHKYILLTHCHYDHMGAADALREIFGAPVVIGEHDKSGLENTDINLSVFLSGTAATLTPDITVCDNDTLELGNGEYITVIATPGHTLGSVCYMLNNAIFTGDTLFMQTCGRVDFPTGNPEQMLKSLKRIADLDGDFDIFPGHDRPTTLNFERKYNPYIKKQTI